MLGIGTRYRAGRVATAPATVLVSLCALAFTAAPALAAAPEVIPGSESVTAVTPEAATLHAEVNPNGEVTECEFQYGADPSLATGTTTTLCEPGALVGTVGAQPVSLTVGGLQPGTTYYYRVVATNATPPAQYGAVESFATPEAPVTESAEALGAKTVALKAVALKGELNPNGATGKLTYQFDYNTNGTCNVVKLTEQEEQKLAEEGKSPPAQLSTPAVEVTEAKQAHVEAEAPGLEPDTSYTFCLVVTNASGGYAQGNEVSVQTGQLAPLVLGGELFSGVGSTSATLEAEIDPGGHRVEYQFEYGTSEGYGSLTPKAEVEQGYKTVKVHAQVNGLQAGTVYHFRVLVSDEEPGLQEGADAQLSTLPTAVSGLPDGRFYELVSPVTPTQDNSVYIPFAGSATDDEPYGGIETTQPFEAAPDGEAVDYLDFPGSSGGNYRLYNGSGNEFLGTRSPAGGWSSVNTTPATAPGVVNAEPEYLAFSSDLSAGVLSTNDKQSLSPQAPSGYANLYVHTSEGTGYQPLLTTTPHRAPAEFSIRYAGGSANFGHLLFEANDALTANAVDGGSEQNNLYDSVDGSLYLVNVLPDGETEPNAAFGSGYAPREHPGLSGVISADGSRVFWTDLNTGVLYVRENDAAPQSPVVDGRCTVAADACTVQVAAGGQFWTASADGAKVFYIEGGLYEYDLESGETVDLSPGVEAQGVIGAGEDGEYVYYVDAADNLELWHDGVTTFIATLSGGDLEGGVEPLDHPENEAGDLEADLGYRTAVVAPDGRGLVFMSSQSLTGYHNEGLDEVFVYQAEQNRLTCVSCNPSGEAPVANELDRGASLGAFIPISRSVMYQPRVISEDGSRVFFDSGQSLVSNATNGKIDVYEWERDGTGSCGQSAGCVYLLSSPTNPSNSFLVDASASGDDVFMVTEAQLVAQDQNDDYDLYDVRVGAQPLASSACTGSGCQGVPAAPPIFATPASVTFAGVGNFAPSVSKPAVKVKAKPLTRAQKLAKALTACKAKHNKQRRSACEQKARRTYRRSK